MGEGARALARKEEVGAEDAEPGKGGEDRPRRAGDRHQGGEGAGAEQPVDPATAPDRENGGRADRASAGGEEDVEGVRGPREKAPARSSRHRGHQSGEVPRRKRRDLAGEGAP